MKIIEQGHDVLFCSCRVLDMIELAGRTCYKSEARVGCSLDGPMPCDGMRYCDSRCEHHSSREFTRRLVRKGHHAMIEHGPSISVRFITSRGMTHELVRHRLASFAQESTRYVRYQDGEVRFVDPRPWSSHSDYKNWREDMAFAEQRYVTALERGQSPQEARGRLPIDLAAEIVITANPREWMHIFSLRCDRAAHPQMRALMRPVREELAGLVPVLFDAGGAE